MCGKNPMASHIVLGSNCHTDDISLVFRMMLLAVFCLHIGHPSIVFDANPNETVMLNSTTSEEVIGMSVLKNRPETA
jgi:hypothetical protein